MPLQRSVIPFARSSRLAFIRGAVPYRVLSRNVTEQRSNRVGIAVASTLGLSLATLYALVADPVHADRPVDLDASSPLRGNEEIRTLRANKSVDNFSIGVPKQTEVLLSRYEETHKPPSGTGISRYDVAQIASNNPLEDDHAESFVPSGDSNWSFFTVIDGHSGWETSALLREELIRSVAGELAGVERQSSDPLGSSDPFGAAITQGFTRLDDWIVHDSVEQVFKSNSRSVATNLLAPAYAGACALLAFYDARTAMLQVALTGDCRAVLGRRRADGKYDLEVLTADQNGDNPAEKARLEAAHPGEEVVKNGRTMGFGPARAFGDARYKWSRAVQDRLKKDYMGRTPPDAIKTPPYFTAAPVVTTTKVQPGDFLVLATDGLWECLTNREVVGLVGEWVHRQEGRRASWVDSWTQWWGGSGSGREVDRLPVVCNDETEKDADVAVRYRQWCAEKKFVNIDANAATHLVRNALGGADEDLREALLSMRSPRARTYWDDITATVVFFGENR